MIKTIELNEFKINFFYILFSGKIYFAHIDVKSTRYFIEQSSLDGSNRLILKNCTKAPSSLTMDFASRRLYFTYKEAGIISYIDLKTKTVNI